MAIIVRVSNVEMRKEAVHIRGNIAKKIAQYYKEIDLERELFRHGWGDFKWNAVQ
jgi:GT2 family glycosyltransferase